MTIKNPTFKKLTLAALISENVTENSEMATDQWKQLLGCEADAELVMWSNEDVIFMPDAYDAVNGGETKDVINAVGGDEVILVEDGLIAVREPVNAHSDKFTLVCVATNFGQFRGFY